MKKLVSTLILCLILFGTMMAQNYWKSLPMQGIFLGVGPDGSLFSYYNHGITRSQDEGQTWEVVLSAETGFDYQFNTHCFTVSPEGRIFLFADSYPRRVLYSDDNGDTWQQGSEMFGLEEAAVMGLYAASNDIVAGWTDTQDVFLTVNGFESYSNPYHLDGFTDDEYIADVIINENKDMYIAMYRIYGTNIGVYHVNIFDMLSWDWAAFENVGIQDLEFDPEGNVVCGVNFGGEFPEFGQEPGFYAFWANSLGIADNGITYRWESGEGNTAVLAYSYDHGETFTEIGEGLPLAQPIPGSDDGRLFKGADNHLYFIGNSQYWKSKSNANDLPNSNPWIGEKIFDEISGLYYNITSDTTVEVTYNEVYNNSYSGDVVIPETVHYGGVAYTVNAVGKMAFANSSPMTSVVVPNTVKFIGESAFDQSKNLRTVILPRSVDSIGSMVFNGCTALINVSFPDNLTYLPDYLFNGCWNLTSFEMSPNITSIGNGSFRGTGLTTIAIPESVRTIGEDAFAYCSNITSMNVPNSVTSIGTGAFQMCTNLVSIQLPDHLEVISDYLLDCCQNLSSIVIPPTVTEIGFGAFTANGISDIEIPSTVTSIGTHAFSSCGNLTSVTLPESMEYLGENVFYNCGRLRRVTLPQNLAFIPKHLFEDCHQLDSIVLPESITSIGGWAFFNCNSLEEIRIPNHVDTIGTAAFLYCTNLRQVELGHSVSCIAEQAFLTQNESLAQQIDTTKKLTVVSHNTTPPQCGYTTFPAAILQEKAIVPCGCEDIYREAWGEYWTGGFEEDCGTSGNEWYYEILNDDGSITYQYLQHSGDTTINDEPVQIIVKINTLYDKGKHVEKSHEYIYERDDKVYWWNKTLEEFTVLYDYNAQVGDEWEINVGLESLLMHVDAVELYEYEGRQYKMLQVSDAENLFSGTIVRGIGHLTSFFPERLLSKGYRVEGIRCFWQDGELVFKYGEKECDEVYEEFHDYSVDDLNGSEEFSIFPNPTDGMITISGRQTGEYRITNLMGQTLMTGQIESENQQINISALSDGMFFITFAGSTRKFIKH
jgi:hypothetical protein